MKTDFGEAESAVVSLRPSGPDVPRPAPRAGTRGVFARHGHGRGIIGVFGLAAVPTLWAVGLDRT
jgi:hypothetical protein